MNPNSLSPYQIELIEQPLEKKLFLEGPAGSGKTTVGVERLLRMQRAGIPASSILLLFPQRTLIAPYRAALRSSDHTIGGQAALLTVGGLARRMIDLFWPLIAAESGFARPELSPSFLTLETALYYMAHLVRPLLDQGFFDSVAIDRNRVYSQILDNLNKSAIIGFPYTEISERLRSAWPADTAQARVYEDAQHCAAVFRDYCLQNNLLDYSLQMEVFWRHLWPNPACREHLQRSYRHLIYENVEEDPPVAHDLIKEWLPAFDSTLLIYDQQAGYRRFLGADPLSGYSLVEHINEHHIFEESLVSNPTLTSFCTQFGQALERSEGNGFHPLSSDLLNQALIYPAETLRFYPQMLDWVVESVAQLVQDGTPPGEIVLLAPLLPDSLRYALTARLEERGIPYRSHRPSRALRDEPVSQALLTLAALAHPDWNIWPSSFEVAYMFLQTLGGIDLVRAQLLVDAVYRNMAGRRTLAPFQLIRPDIRERITYEVGKHYEELRVWLESYTTDPEAELDFFFSRLFGEVLSQPGFAFHANYEAGTVCANLIESAQKFRWAVGDRVPVTNDPSMPETSLGQEYLTMIKEGVLAAQYIEAWHIPPDDAVLIAPAYTFLLANQPVDYQFWLDVGSQAWAERLYQPLTHAYILSRRWQRGRVWTDVDEYEHNRDTLYHLVLGLVRRCRKQIFLGLCEMGESGFEARGMLLRALQIVLQQSRGYSR